MLVLVASFIFSGLGLFGLVELWRRRPARTFLISIAGLAACVVVAMTAELWFPLFGMNRGDGQVFIGYYLLGLGALGALTALGVLAAIAFGLRPASQSSAASSANGIDA